MTRDYRATDAQLVANPHFHAQNAYALVMDREAAARLPHVSSRRGQIADS
jgi:hypothetical protein